MKKRLLRIEEGVPSKQARLSLQISVRQHSLLQRGLRRLSIRQGEGNRAVFTNQTYNQQTPQRPYCGRLVHIYKH